MSDHIGAKLIYDDLPSCASYLIGGKGYDSDEFRQALKAKGIKPCIPPRKGSSNALWTNGGLMYAPPFR